MAEPRRTVLARISGRVQGVSFRVWTQFEAEKLGLSGWVRNEDDGSVTALISGPEVLVAKMVERLRRGPSGARVAEVVLEEMELTEAPAGFRISA